MRNRTVFILIVPILMAIDAAPSFPTFLTLADNDLFTTSHARYVNSDGSEDIEALFQKAKCIECHIIPGIRGANGTIGPSLIMGSIGPKRLREARYKGMATTTREYVMESILDHNQYIPNGYKPVPMPMDYKTKLAAGAIYEMVVYLSQLQIGYLPQTPKDPCGLQERVNDLHLEKMRSATPMC